MQSDYVHGYTDRESGRLKDQANSLSEILHHDSIFPKNSRILEAGCGVGAQTSIIAQKNPDSQFISIDISENSINKARGHITSLGITNVEFETGDIFDLKYPDEFFDHILVCFVLEHLPDPVTALQSLKRVLRRGGTITLIEGDHGSTFFYPYSDFASEVIRAQTILQSKSGGNALIGRQLFPLLVKADFTECIVSPRMVYVDNSKPELMESFTKNTFTAMIEGIKEKAIQDSVIDSTTFDRGINDLKRTCSPDGVFCYTFFKGVGYKG
jgi:ubiquinone/menaquinone biosynthesis C-methylase UbiE